MLEFIILCIIVDILANITFEDKSVPRRPLKKDVKRNPEKLAELKDLEKIASELAEECYNAPTDRELYAELAQTQLKIDEYYKR